MQAVSFRPPMMTPRRFGQTEKTNALQADLNKLGKELTQPSAKTRSCLATLIEWFTLGAVWELGESFVHVLIGVLKYVIENAGDILGNLF